MHVPKGRNVSPLVQDDWLKTQPPRHSQKTNFTRPPVHFVEDEFERSTNLQGTASSSGVECSGVPIYTPCSNAGVGFFTSFSFRFLDCYNYLEKISSPASLHQQLREATPPKAEVAGQVYCSQMRGPLLPELSRGLPGQCPIAQWGAALSLGLGCLQLFTCVAGAALDFTVWVSVCEKQIAVLCYVLLKKWILAWLSVIESYRDSAM